MTEQPARRWPKTGTAGAHTTMDVGDHCTTGDPAPRIAAQPYPGEQRTFAAGGLVMPPGTGASDVVPLPVSRCLYETGLPAAPPAAELAAIADDLNAHGGLDETFVAELLRQAADPYADAKRQLGIVDPPPAPVKTTKPITYEEIVAALEKIAPLGPQRLDVVKLTQEQIDAITASQPHAAPSVGPWHYFGTPVEIVDTVEESTPYQLAHAQPGGIIEIHGHLTAPEFERLRTDWLRAYDARPRPPQWTLGSKLVPVSSPSGGPPSAAEGVDVMTRDGLLRLRAVPEPRPWWRRALDRVRRRR